MKEALRRFILSFYQHAFVTEAFYFSDRNFSRWQKTFSMTKIPYGTYDYMYFTGRNWSNSVLINNGTIRGGFQDYKSFNKNNYNEDQMEFKRGYYGSFTIRLTQSIGGNLETKSTSESDFFN